MSKRIIIAEDSSVIQNLTRKILEQQNYQVTIAKNGQQVLDLLEKDTYDLILLDIHMPVMNGMICAREIRKESNPQCEIPIIAITGNLNNYSAEHFNEVGINLHIQKPINYDRLVDHIKSLI